MNVKRLLMGVVVGVSLLPLIPQFGIARSQNAHAHEEGEISPEVSQLISDVRLETAPFRDFSSI